MFFWFMIGYIVGTVITLVVVALVSAYVDDDDIQYTDRRKI